ncbi:MAG: hypothetical protein HC809_03570 [Gammaproteobacteria bacterium]|nr:hypothetical protein [Gammaproteobacteria bacterium]
MGTASVESLAQGAATMPNFPVEPCQFDDVLCVQVIAEMRNSAREAVLPPSLHPTIPAALSIQAWRVGGSQWGAFNLVMTRVSCRSGVRARGFTTGVLVTTKAACDGLRTTLGLPAAVADITIRDGYDAVTVAAIRDGRAALSINAIDPEPMSPDDVQYTSTIHLAHTPNGLRLVQLEAEHHATRVERLAATLGTFDAEAWGERRLDPYRIVSASSAQGHIVIPAIRFVCKPDELAFTGTESVNA